MQKKVHPYWTKPILDWVPSVNMGYNNSGISNDLQVERFNRTQRRHEKQQHSETCTLEQERDQQTAILGFEDPTGTSRHIGSYRTYTFNKK